MGRECRGTQAAVLAQEVKHLQTQRRGDRADTRVESVADCVRVESDRSDVGDTLRSRHLTDNQVSAASRHEPLNLGGNQSSHL
jgi:hypothetical protein